MNPTLSEEHFWGILSDVGHKYYIQYMWFTCTWAVYSGFKNLYLQLTNSLQSECIPYVHHRRLMTSYIDMGDAHAVPTLQSREPAPCKCSSRRQAFADDRTWHLQQFGSHNRNVETSMAGSLAPVNVSSHPSVHLEVSEMTMTTLSVFFRGVAS